MSTYSVVDPNWRDRQRDEMWAAIAAIAGNVSQGIQNRGNQAAQLYFEGAQQGLDPDSPTMQKARKRMDRAGDFRGQGDMAYDLARLLHTRTAPELETSKAAMRGFQAKTKWGEEADRLQTQARSRAVGGQVASQAAPSFAGDMAAAMGQEAQSQVDQGPVHFLQAAKKELKPSDWQALTHLASKMGWDFSQMGATTPPDPLAQTNPTVRGEILAEMGQLGPRADVASARAAGAMPGAGQELSATVSREQMAAAAKLQESRERIAQARDKLGWAREKRLASGGQRAASQGPDERKLRQDLIKLHGDEIIHEAKEDLAAWRAIPARQRGRGGAEMPRVPSKLEAQKAGARRVAEGEAPEIAEALGMLEQVGQQAQAAAFPPVGGRPDPEARQIARAVEQAQGRVETMLLRGEDPALVARFLQEFLQGLLGQ